MKFKKMRIYSSMKYFITVLYKKILGNVCWDYRDEHEAHYLKYC